jgi:hypothetical protein
MVMLNRAVWASGAALVAFGLLGSACARPESSDPQPAANSLSDLDAHRQTDVAFFSQLRLRSGAIRQPPATLDEATQKATAVVLADVASVAPTRMVHDVQMLGVTLRPVEILSGALRTDPQSPVVVEMIGSAAATDAGKLAGLNAALPKGRSVWFLRWQGEPPETVKPGAPTDGPEDSRLYGLVSIIGVFVQGPDGVMSALVGGPDRERTTFQGHAEGLKTMSTLVAYVRAVKK